jgi:hypothetical protein
MTANLGKVIKSPRNFSGDGIVVGHQLQAECPLTLKELKYLYYKMSSFHSRGSLLGLGDGERDMLTRFSAVSGSGDNWDDPGEHFYIILC